MKRKTSSKRSGRDTAAQRSGKERSGKLQWQSIPGVQDRTLAVGRQLKSFRDQAGYTLEKLSELTGKRNPARRRMTAAQISRIENGQIAPDLPELELLCLALERDLRELFQPATKPWFVVRRGKSEEWLQEVLDGRRVIERQTGRHAKLIKDGVYRYLPLEDEPGTAEKPGLVESNERAGTMTPLMRKNLLIVGKADEGDVKEALIGHPGEEIIFVLEGELDFWFCQQRGDPPQHLDSPLGPGDCLHFSSELLHGFRAPGKTTVRAFQIFCEPGTRRDFYGELRTENGAF